MFNNLFNKHDVHLAWDKVKGGQAKRIWEKLLGSDKKRTQLAWERTKLPPSNWWDIPAVQTRWNLLVSGDAEVGFNDHICRRYLSGRKNLKALSLGCGTGVREQRWAATGKFKRITAFDQSAERIAFARKSAEENGFADILEFHVGDVYKIDLPVESYDTVMVEGSLHHFTPLRQILLHIEACLKSDGFFFLDEFIGPTRFQWTARQLDVINGLLSILPEKYRTTWGSDVIKREVVRPSRLLVRFGDPSEAVDSANIIPLLHEIFNVVEIKEYGGAVLHMLFNGIGHNFLDDNSETQRFVRLCFEAEDALMTSGDIGSDFAIVVCKKRSDNPGTPLNRL